MFSDLTYSSIERNIFFVAETNQDERHALLCEEAHYTVSPLYPWTVRAYRHARAASSRKCMDRTLSNPVFRNLWNSIR